mmetsp:Transcript_117722/g.344841  ORF Transcript_117722/g.344841 Transcript_117722/m.344841 type:complete len:224 (+) Transcript_117722:617-1288(+)
MLKAPEHPHDLLEVLVEGRDAPDPVPDAGDVDLAGAVPVEPLEYVSQFIGGRSGHVVGPQPLNNLLHAVPRVEVAQRVELLRGQVVLLGLRHVLQVSGEPWMISDIVSGVTVHNVHNQHLLHEVFCLLRDVVPDFQRSELEAPPFDLLQDGNLRVPVEWWAATEDHKEDNAQRPHIHLLRVGQLLPGEDLRRDVVQRADLRLQGAARSELLRSGEVDELHGCL